MLESIRRFFSAPVFEGDEDKNRGARILNAILNTLLVVVLLANAALLLGVPNPWATLLPIDSVLLMIVVSRLLMLRGNVSLGGSVLAASLWLVITLLIFLSGGLDTAASFAYVLVILMAGLLLGGRATIMVALLSVAASTGFYAADSAGHLPQAFLPETPFITWLALCVILIMSAVLLYLAVRGLTDALNRARRHESDLETRAQELEASRAAFEFRSRDLERRSEYSLASAEVSRAVSSILEVDDLISQVVDLIRQRFGLYYVGLFMVDETRQWAVLRAGTGQAGQTMLERGHRIRVGEGMIGWSIANAESRSAAAAEEDMVRRATAELPDTRSEAALPLRSRGQVLGAFTVQDDETGAFDVETLRVLQTMADQVAIALDNARLLAQSQAALEAERRAHGEITRAAWDQIIRTRVNPGYRCTSKEEVRPSTRQWTEDMKAAQQGGQLVQDEDNAIALPVKIRDQVTGVVRLRKPEDSGGWTASELELVQTLAERLGDAMESARLYQDTQRRAAREQLARQITDRMRRAQDMEALIQITVQEMAAALGASHTFVQLSALPKAADQATD